MGNEEEQLPSYAFLQAYLLLKKINKYAPMIPPDIARMYEDKSKLDIFRAFKIKIKIKKRTKKMKVIVNDE